MKRNLTLAAAILFGTSALTAPALANDPAAGASGQTDSSMQLDRSGGSTSSSGGAYGGDGVGATGSLGAQDSYGQVISSLRDGSTNASRLEGMSEISSVNVVRIDDLTGQGDPMALENAINENSSQVSQLQEAIEANSELKSQLDDENVDVSDVFATDISDDHITVYVR